MFQREEECADHDRGRKNVDSENMASPIGCCCFGSLVKTSVKAIGIRTPPKKPWNPRSRIMEGRSVAKAQATEKAAKRVAWERMILRNENTRLR